MEGADYQDFVASVEALIKTSISDNDLDGLLMSVALARIDDAERTRSSRGKKTTMVATEMARRQRLHKRRERVTGKDIEGQLSAMLKESDEALLEAIKNCDSQTFNLIQDANAELLTYVILRDGVFVDDKGDEYRTSPPAIWFNPVNDLPVLPDGVEGLRRAIKFAANTLLPEKMEIFRNVGAKSKQALDDLFACCRYLHRKYLPDLNQKPSIDRYSGEPSPLINFTYELLRAAGLPMQRSGILERFKEMEKEKKGSKKKTNDKDKGERVSHGNAKIMAAYLRRTDNHMTEK